MVNTWGNGGYFISSGISTGWRNLPFDLEKVVEDALDKGEEIQAISLGPDGDWFLRTNMRVAHWYAQIKAGGQAGQISNVRIFQRLARSDGLDLTGFVMQFFTFVPDHTGYVTVLHDTKNLLTRCAWRNVPPALDSFLEREGHQGVHHVAVGVRGSYVVILNSGKVCWHGVPEPLNRLLNNADQSRRGVVTVSLSLVEASWYFVEFSDGVVEYSARPEWHQPLINHCHMSYTNTQRKMGSPYNAPPSPPPYSPPPQYSNFNPSTFGYGHSSPPTPYLSPMPTGSPQPIYNIINLQNNNALPYGPEKPSNNNFELLGGALKVAAAILPLFMGGVGFGLGN
ncbi:hypothetical protein BC834DRAFT_889170 [Gloeopeniophorella convolvens]|nr:hypothetical protein BC834DRAFT_889170 [Gloeopeniophorella convolvens]